MAACAEAAAEDKDEEDEHEGVLAMELPDRELTDAEKVALWTRLEGKRTEWDALAFGKVSARAFQVTFTKGEWTKRVKGVDYDFALGRAVGKTTKDWCKRYRMPDNARFSTVSYGGEHEATVLAQGWCSRMDHFLSIHTAAGTMPIASPVTMPIRGTLLLAGRPSMILCLLGGRLVCKMSSRSCPLLKGACACNNGRSGRVLCRLIPLG